MSKKLIFSMGGKGGVGKTLALVTLADYLRTQGTAFAALDCDTENAGKASAFAHFIKEAGKPNLRNEKDCDKLLHVAATSEADITIADFPANSAGDVGKWFEEVATEETLKALDIELIAMGVITPEIATFASVAEWAQKLQDRASYIVVLNYRSQSRVQDTAEAVFHEYFNTATGKRFQESFDPKTVIMKPLYDEAMKLLLQTGQLPTDALTNPPKSGEGKDVSHILVSSRIKSWITGLHTEWAKTGIVPKASTSKTK